MPVSPAPLNFLLATWDACRFDTYEAARTPVLDGYAHARRAYAPGTFTFASHAAMFQGMLPHVFEPEPFYNRFIRQLWRIEHRGMARQPLVTFRRGVRSIISGFRGEGYLTVGTAAMAWFRGNPILTEEFEVFDWTGINARRQVNWLTEQLGRRPTLPFFAFVNFGETHSPYEHEGMPGLTGRSGEGDVPGGSAARQGLRLAEWRFDEANWKKQVACAEFLDARMGDLIRFLEQSRRRTIVVVCGDHGECFGEDGLYGHGVYHPKIMEVAMLIFGVGIKLPQ